MRSVARRFKGMSFAPFGIRFAATTTRRIEGHKLLSAFQMLCAEASVNPRTRGLDVGVLSSFAATNPQLFATTSVADGDVRDAIGSLSCLTIEGGKLRICGGSNEVIAVYAPMMAALAQILAAGHKPPQKVPIAAVRDAIETRFPAFDFEHVGASSLPDALRSFPALFRVSDDGSTVELVGDNGQQRQPSTTASRSSVELSATSAGGLVEEALVAIREKHGDDSAWIDLELLMVRDLRLRPLQNLPAEEIVAALKSREAVIEFEARKVLRPVMRPRAAHLFVDADEVSPVDVIDICRQLNIDLARSSKIVARHAASTEHTPHDIVVPPHVPPYMRLELEASKLRSASTVVLRDVVFMCGWRKKEMYASNVARAVAFPDATVLVATKDETLRVAAPSSGEQR